MPAGKIPRRNFKNAWIYNGLPEELKLDAIGPVRSFCFLLPTEPKFRQRPGRRKIVNQLARAFDLPGVNTAGPLQKRVSGRTWTPGVRCPLKTGFWAGRPGKWLETVSERESKKGFTYNLRWLYYRFGMTTTLQPVSVKLRVGDLRRIPTENRSEFIRDAVSEKLARMGKPGWAPRTATGRKLAALRGRFVEEGGELLDADGIARELRERRGGLA
jgi:hypothetical protein